MVSSGIADNVGLRNLTNSLSLLSDVKYNLLLLSDVTDSLLLLPDVTDSLSLLSDVTNSLLLLSDMTDYIAFIRRDRQSRGDKLVSQIVVSAVAVKQSMILTDPADSVGGRNLLDRLEFTSNMKPSFSKLCRL